MKIQITPFRRSIASPRWCVFCTHPTTLIRVIDHQWIDRSSIAIDASKASMIYNSRQILNLCGRTFEIE